MNSKRTPVKSFLLSVAAIAAFTFCVVGTGNQRALADLNCSGTVSGSTQQGAICLPGDPTGVTAKIPDSSAKGIILQVIQIMLGVAMLVAIIFVILGGYRYIFDAGNGEQAEKGKKTITNALIGIVVIVLSYTIVVVVMHTASNLDTAGQSTSGSSSSPSTSTPASPGGVTTSVVCSNGAVVTYAAECDQVITH